MLNNLYLNDENKEARNDSNLKTNFICLEESFTQAAFDACDCGGWVQ